jgi:hypothetical protein
MKTNFLSLLLMCSLLWSCGGSSDQPEANGSDSIAPIVDSTQTPVDELTDFKFQIYIANIPSPFESMKDLATAEFPFRADLVNNVENEKKYMTSVKKALNFGVYAVDLAYIANNNQFKDAPKHLEAVYKLSASLDADESFNKIVGSRLENNLENKDTITRVIDQAFAETDKYMRTNEREMVAVTALTGAWLESQNIIFSLLKDQEKSDKNAFLHRKIWEMRFHLNSLVGLVQQFPEEAELKALSAKLSSLNEDFKLVKEEKDLTKEKINELGGKISKIRSMIVS